MPTCVEDYTVGWICAVETERVVACELLDEEYTNGNEPQIDNLRDHNIYTFGRMHNHHVVIAGLPYGRYGMSSATRVVEHMQLSFPALRLSLMVGIAGGVPSQKHDIRLGDVVVSCPVGKHGGIIHYDFGIATQSQDFDETGHLSSPSNILLNAVGTLKARYKRDGHNILSIITTMLERNGRLRAEYSRPGAGLDRLYKSAYVHSDQKLCDCESLLENREEICLEDKEETDLETRGESRPGKCSYLIQRNRRGLNEDDPTIHYGLIASADRLVKDATLRDALAQKHDVLCFEMEAAGLMNSDLRFLVIRGICDYADSHKNDTWQGYAAATAASYAKELLKVIPCPAQTTNLQSRSLQRLTDINLQVAPGNIPRPSDHLAQDNPRIDIFLAHIRNVFTRSLKAKRDVRIDACIEIAKHGDHLKTFIRAQHDNSIEEERGIHDTDQDQVLYNCISKCRSYKPPEAAESLSRSFSGSAKFFFEKGNTFFPGQYSVSQTLQDRIFFLASKEITNGTNGYSIELLLNYLVKRRRWQRVHVFVTAAAKTGDLCLVPISKIENNHWAFWTAPRALVQLLENVLQDLELKGPVINVHLRLYSHPSGTFEYNPEEVEAKVDYQQKSHLERIEGNAIRHLQSLGCAQYQESQLTTLRRQSKDTFLVTDGSNNYIQYMAPFAYDLWGNDEFKSFIKEILRLQYRHGAIKSIGVVLDDHRNHVKGYLVESFFLCVNWTFTWAKVKNYMVPQALRWYWAKQLIRSVSEIHSKGIVIGVFGSAISYSLDIQVRNQFWGCDHFPPDQDGLRAPEHRDIASECIKSSQKSDIFQLGMHLWKLLEHEAVSKTHFCVAAGCTTRPHYSCRNPHHRNPISLPFLQYGNPLLTSIVKKCRAEDPDERPSAQELAHTISKALVFEENEVQISQQKNDFRIAMRDALEYGSMMLIGCDECNMPCMSSYFHCNICCEGGFNLCHFCVERGLHCFDSNHQLVKRRRDASGILIQES